MIKQMAWNIFKNTGNIDTFMEFVQLKNIEEKMIGETNGDSKDKGNYNIGEQYGRL